MSIYYIVSRPDGTDYKYPEINYANMIDSTLNMKTFWCDKTHNSFQVSTTPSDYRGMCWPCRLFEVEVDETYASLTVYDNMFSSQSLSVVRELPAHFALGPNGVEISDFLKTVGDLNIGQMLQLGAKSVSMTTGPISQIDARNAAEDLAENTGRGAALRALWGCAGEDLSEQYLETWADAIEAIDAITNLPSLIWDSASDMSLNTISAVSIQASTTAVKNVLRALLTRDVLDVHHYNKLTEPWRKSVGPVHRLDVI